jgi:hypothetical protein
MMKATIFPAVLKLTPIYFLASLVFILCFSFSFLFALFSLMPLSLRSNLLAGISHLLTQTWLRSLPPFILIELPFALLAFLIIFLIFRTRFNLLNHLIASTISFCLLLLIGSYTYFKPINLSGHRMPGFFSTKLSVKQASCDLMPQESIYNWTYPLNDQTNLSVHSPIVVNLKENVSLNGSCEATYAHMKPANSSKILGQTVSGNLPLVPDNPNALTELTYLSHAPINDIRNFSSSGSWDRFATITVTCNYQKSGCSGSESFSFVVAN